MKKNVASQKVGAQMVSASDGSAFTGSVTVYVTGDAGTQAAGSVGSGACTHEGNGYHTYAPAQVETNYDLIAFTFTGSGAVPGTVQVFTAFPQTVDNATNIAAIKAKTDNLTSDPADASDIAALFSALPAAVWAYACDGAITAVQLMRGFASALMGKASGMATTTAVLRDLADTKDRITATVDADGNRSAVTRDLT